MGAFENFPYTNFHDLNLDWILKVIKDFNGKYPEVVETIKNKMDKPINAGTDGNVLIKDGDGSRWGDFGESIDFQQYVNEWLDDHPEATTTVEDGSLTQAKFTDELKKQTIKDYLTPEMFGAVGDGNTDDTVALQSAVTMANVMKLPVMLVGDYYITETINVPSNVTISSFCKSYRSKRILVASDIGTAFKVTAICEFSYFTIAPKAGTFQKYTAFEFDGIGLDVDSKIDRVLISNAEYGVICKGRNLEVTRSNFSHCQYGFYQNTPENNGIRGIIINGCRFHGIGEDLEYADNTESNMIETDRCAGILLDCDYISASSSDVAQVQIINNLADQGGTFIKGQVNRCLIANNMVASFRRPAIRFIGNHPNPYQDGAILVTGNVLYGKNGNDTTGVNHPRPDYAIGVETYGNIMITGNVFGQVYNGISLSGASRMNIDNNLYMVFQDSNLNPKCYAVLCYNSQFTFYNNRSLRHTIYLAKLETGDTTSECYVSNNTQIRSSNTSDELQITVHNGLSYYFQNNSESYANGSIIPGLNKFDSFQIRTYGRGISYDVKRVTGNYWTTTTSFDTTTNRFSFIVIETVTQEGQPDEIRVTVKEMGTDGTIITPNVNFYIRIPE